MPRVDMEVFPGKGIFYDIVQALCDTGASVSILSGETARRLGLNLEESSSTVIKLASADDREIPMLGEADVWVRANNQYKRKIRVAVVDGLDEQLIIEGIHNKFEVSWLQNFIMLDRYLLDQTPNAFQLISKFLV